MEQNITKRLAARNLNTAKVSVAWLFKIVETVLGSRIVSVSAHMTPSSRHFCAIVFEKAEDAKKIYDFCDGLHIEDTDECFDLAFIPDDMDIGPSTDVCRDSREFRHAKAAAGRKPADYSDMVEASDENNALEDEIPEKLRRKESPAPPAEMRPRNPANEKEAARREQVAAATAEALNEPDAADELRGFRFDATDRRFEAVLSNADFLVDASHKKFNREAGMAEILDEIRKRHEDL